MSKKQKKKQKIEQFRLPERKIAKPQAEAQEDNVPEKAVEEVAAAEKAVAVEEVVVTQATVEKTICEEAAVTVEGAVEEAAVNSEKKTEVHAKEPINPEASKEVVIEEVAEPETTQEAATEETAAVQTVQEPKITEWKQSESAVADTKKPEEGTTSEKKASVLKPVGIVMLIVVVVVGIVLVATGKHRDKAVVSDNVVTTTPTAAELTSDLSTNPAIGLTDTVTPTEAPDSKLDMAGTVTPTVVPTPTDIPDATETDATVPDPTPTDLPEATLTPTLTPTSTPTPVVSADTSQGKYDQYSDTHMGWGVGRNNEHQQPTAWGYDIKYNFDEVGAYYVDKNVSEDDKVIYLTINCGYEVGYTPECLDTLKKHDVKASFFILEDYIHQCADQIRRMKEEGHLVGNHSAMHLDYGNTSPEKVIADMLRNEEQMREYVGYEMDKIFRPPSGYYNEQTLYIAKDLGYKTYFWSMAYVDWDPDDQPTEEYVVNFFQENHHNGAIPVIHITSSSGVKSLDKLITMLKEEGYRFGLVTEME